MEWGKQENNQLRRGKLFGSSKNHVIIYGINQITYFWPSIMYSYTIMIVFCFPFSVLPLEINKQYCFFSHMHVTKSSDVLTQNVETDAISIAIPFSICNTSQ